MADSDLREAYSAANAQEAHSIKAMLNEAGIEARVVGELLQNAVGDFSAGAISPRVWVRSNDFDRARQIISDQLQIDALRRCGGLQLASGLIAWPNEGSWLPQLCRTPTGDFT